MKKRIFSVLMTMVLVLSLGLVFSAPAGAQNYACYYTLGGSTNNTGEWSTTTKNSGTYSALLTYTQMGSAWAQLTPPTGITLAEFIANPTQYGFWYLLEIGADLGPQLELRFTNGNLGLVEITAEAALYSVPGTGGWLEATLSAGELCHWYANAPDGTSFQYDGVPGNNLLQNLQGLIDTAMVAVDGDAGSTAAWELTRVRVDLGWGGTAPRTVYIDDVTIADTTYDLEPFSVSIVDITDKYVSQNFDVTANITNHSTDIVDLKAIIDIGAGATWVSGGVADLSDHPQYETTLQPCETWTVTWTLHCTGAGDTDIVVKAKARPFYNDSQIPDFYEWVAATVTVTQNQAEVAIVITEPAGGTDMVVHQTFPVTATVTSSGGNTNVAATIIPPVGTEWVTGGTTPSPHTITIGAMSHGDTEQVTWTLRCTAAGLNINIPVAAVSTQDPSGNTDTVLVDQLAPTHPALVATVTGPSKAYESQTFSIHGSIQNTGEETAMDVTATISFVDALADLVLPGETAIKHLGDIPAGATHLVEWTVHCTGADLDPDSFPSTIWVTPAGLDDVTGEAITAITAGYAEVPQYPRQLIDVEITAPDPLEKWGPACGTHNVNFTVTNTGYADLTDVTVTLEIDGNAEIESGLPADLVIDIGDLNQDASDTGSFVIVCTGEDDEVGGVVDYTTFTVTATGVSEVCDEPVTDSDSVEVYQKYMIVVITAPTDSEFCVGDDILVDFTVQNCYPGTLSAVRAVITWTGSVHLDPAWPAEITIPPMNTGDTWSPEPVGWHLECDATGQVTVNVYVSGVFDTTTISNDDEITFNQVTGPVLEATIDSPETCQWYVVGDTFTVTGTIENTGDGKATGVKATLTFVITGEAVGTGNASTTVFPLDYANIYPGSETIYLDAVAVAATAYTMDNPNGTVTFDTAPGTGVVITADYKTTDPIDGATITPPNPDWTGQTLLSGASKTAAWTVTCTGPTLYDTEEECDVVFSIEVTGEGVCSPPSVSASSSTVTVHQLPLAVTVSILTEGDVITGETFSVDAIIRNVGGGDTCPCEIEDVTATISITGPASLVFGETATKTVGTVPYNVEQPGAEGLSAQWTVQCDRPGLVTITVTAETSTNPMTGLPLGYTLSITSNSVAVTQLPALIAYNVPLAKDWNFFSVPIFPIDTDIEEVLYSIEDGYTEVWSYVGQEWQVYVPGASDAYYTALGLDKITDIEAGIGYIIRMINADTVTGQGYELEPGKELPPTYELLPGWNLTGFKTMDFSGYGQITQALDTMRVGYYLGNVDANYDTFIIGQEARFLRWYNPGEGWKELAQNDNMWIGKGCWLWASQSGLVIVPPVVAE